MSLHSKEVFSAPTGSGVIGVSRVSTGYLVRADRCLSNLGFDLSRHPLCSRNYAALLNGRGPLYRLRRIFIRHAPNERRLCAEVVGMAQRGDHRDFSLTRFVPVDDGLASWPPA